MSSKYRDRLVAYYQKYNPEKTSSVDATLQKFVGREEEMFKALVAKYGPEPGASVAGTNASAAPAGGAAATANINYRNRLVAFYQKYNPEKMSGVDATLQKFVGREEEMFKALVGKYGPEPEGVAATATRRPSASLTSAPSLTLNPSSVVSSASTSAAAGAGGGNFRNRLVAYYQKYNPEKLSGVDATLQKFVGKEQEMFKALVAKYGPEPPAAAAAASSLDNSNDASRTRSISEGSLLASPLTPGAGASFRDRLVAYYQKYNPEKMSGVDATLQKFAGREEEMFKALVAKYGAEPATATTSNPSSSQSPSPSPNPWSVGPLSSPSSSGLSHYERLTNYYKKYNPTKIGTVEATLQKFIGREEEMFKALVAKYGPEPAASDTSASTPAAPPPGAASATSVSASGSSSSSSSSSYRDRLAAYYQKYNAEKMSTVDATLQKFVGREEEMFKALVGKYGPEPESGNGDTQPQSAVGGSGAHPGPRYRDRLVAYYQKYNPEKMNIVDSTLQKFTGREEEMFKALVNKYGPEPSPTPSPNVNSASLSVGAAQQQVSSSTNNSNNNGSNVAASINQPPEADDNTIKSRLTRFYRKYAPERLPKVDNHLAKYAGREDELFKALVNNYGPEPPATPAVSALGVPPTHHQQQHQQQSSSSSNESLTTKQRLINFYKQHVPDRLSKVDDHLTKYAGREEELFKALVAKYGPEPKASTVSANASPATASLGVPPSLAPTPTPPPHSTEPLPWKTRFTNFYKQYAPDKIAKVSDQMSKYAGREEDLMKALVSKYGTEPKQLQSPASPSPGSARSPAQQFLSAHDSSHEASATSAAASPLAQPKVDPVQAILNQQLSMLAPDEAQQLSAVANSAALLRLIKNVSSTLGGSVAAAGSILSEGKMRALREDESEHRDILSRVQEDEFGILTHMSQTALNKITSAQESEQLQQKTSQMLRKMYLDLWGEYAKDRIKARRREAAALLTPYQRIAFSKSKSGLRRFQEDHNLSPNSASSFASPNRNSKPLVTSRTIPAPVPSQQLNTISSIAIATATAKRASSSSTNRYPSSYQNTPRSTASRGVSPRTGSVSGRAATTHHNNNSAFISAAHQNSTLNPALVSINSSRPSTSRIHSLPPPPSARTNASRHDLAKNRHQAETRVEKLSDNQLRSLHRRLEKWGLPVPGFVKNTLKTRGLSVSLSDQQNDAVHGSYSNNGSFNTTAASTPRFFSNKYNDPNYSSAAVNNEELDAQVMKVLESMHLRDEQDYAESR